MSRLRWLTVMIAVGLLVAACGDDSGGGEADTTTSASSATTTTDPGPTGFDETVLPDAIANEGDAAIVIDPAAPHEIDLIWPADGFPAERAAYEDAGFIDGTFVSFGDDTPEFGGFNAAHRFEDADGAAAGMATLEAWHRVPDNPAMAFGIAADDLPTLAELDVAVGDEVSAFVHSGPTFQVAVIVWRTDNVVHVLRAAMPAGDTARVAILQAVAEAIDARLSG